MGYIPGGFFWAGVNIFGAYGRIRNERLATSVESKQKQTRTSFFIYLLYFTEN